MRRWLLDFAMVLWTAGWFVVAGYVVHDMRSVAELGDTLVAAGEALDETATGLERIENAPLIGDVLELRSIRERVRRAAREAQVSGVRSKEDINRLAWLLGIAVALVPTVPLLVFRWAPRR